MDRKAHRVAGESFLQGVAGASGTSRFRQPVRVSILTFAIAAFLLGNLYTPSARAATTGQVTVTGNVPIACDLAVQQEASADSIPDISAGHTHRHVATVSETCNTPDGYTVTVTGSNSGDHNGMFVDLVSADSHPFTIRYDGVSVPPGGLVTDSTAPAFNVSKNVDITYPADETLTGTVANTYEETLTFTISAK